MSTLFGNGHRNLITCRQGILTLPRLECGASDPSNHEIEIVEVFLMLVQEAYRKAV